MANETSIWVTARRIAKLDETATAIAEKTGLTAEDRKRASEALRASLVEAAKHLYAAACPADAFAAELRQTRTVVKTKADLLQAQVEDFCGSRSRLRPTFTVIHTEDQDGNTAVFRLTKGHMEVLAAGVATQSEPAPEWTQSLAMGVDVARGDSGSQSTRLAVVANQDEEPFWIDAAQLSPGDLEVIREILGQPGAKIVFYRPGMQAYTYFAGPPVGGTPDGSRIEPVPVTAAPGIADSLKEDVLDAQLRKGLVAPGSELHRALAEDIANLRLQIVADHRRAEVRRAAETQRVHDERLKRAIAQQDERRILGLAKDAQDQAERIRAAEERGFQRAQMRAAIVLDKVSDTWGALSAKAALQEAWVKVRDMRMEG